MPIESSPTAWPNSVLHPIIADPTNNPTSYNEESSSAPRFAPIENTSPQLDGSHSRPPIGYSTDLGLVVIGKQTSAQRQRLLPAASPNVSKREFLGRNKHRSAAADDPPDSPAAVPDHYVFEALARHELAFEIASEPYNIAGLHAIDRPVGMLMANGPPHESEIEHVKDQRDATFLQRRKLAAAQ
jgi:hypothetical protein